MKIPPDWYTIPRLADHWQVDESDVLHLLETFQILPSFKLVNAPLELWEYPPEIDEALNHSGRCGRHHTGLLNLDIFTTRYIFHDIPFAEQSAEQWCYDLENVIIEDRHYPGWRYQLLKSHIVTVADILITAEEVKRYESEHFAPALPPTDPSDVRVIDEQAPPETDVQMCERLKGEGLTEVQIAHRLKEAFPSILPSRIGRLVTAVPGVIVETDAYRKRGVRLLKKSSS